MRRAGAGQLGPSAPTGSPAQPGHFAQPGSPTLLNLSAPSSSATQPNPSSSLGLSTQLSSPARPSSFAQPNRTDQARSSSPASLEEMCGDAHVIAVIGSGGKTTLIETLARQLRRRHPDSVVAISTTTRQWPPSRLPLIANQTAGEAMSQLARLGVAYVADTCPARGASATSGSDATDPTTAISQQDQTASNTSAVKLCEPSWGIDRLAADVVASGGYLLIEADGSRGLPLKAHADWEPVVPPSTQRCILVVGASGFGRPVRAAAHRPELFCSRAGCSLESAASPERVADEIAFEIGSGTLRFDAAFVNQVDSGRTRPSQASRIQPDCPQAYSGHGKASLSPRAPQPCLNLAQPRPTQALPHSAQSQPCLAPAQPRSAQTEVFAFASELRKRGISAPIWFGSARAGVATLATFG